MSETADRPPILRQRMVSVGTLLDRRWHTWQVCLYRTADKLQPWRISLMHQGRSVETYYVASRSLAEDISARMVAQVRRS